MESTAFFIFLFIHLAGLVLGFGSVIVTDLFGLLWIMKIVRFRQVVHVSDITEKFVWVGWGLLVAAGIPLIYFKGFIDNLMILKLFFVLLIGVNGIPLHFLQKNLRGYKTGDQIPNVIMFRLMLALSISQIGWWGAVTIGFLHRHVQSIIEWPDHPWLVSTMFLAAILIIWAAGEMLFKSMSSNSKK